MKILLLNFHFEEGANPSKGFMTQTTFVTFVPSLTLRQLVSLTPESHDITLIEDLEPKNIDFDNNYDLVCISSVTSGIIRAYQVADEFRRRGIKVVLGGYHPTALPEEAKHHADAVVIGPAEFSWKQIIKDVEKGMLKSFYNQNIADDLNTIPRPDRERFEWKGKINSIKTTNGCPVGCEFCSVSNTKFKNVLRTSPIEKIVEEIGKIPQKYLFFCDPSLTTDPKYSKELFREIADFNKILINCYGNINVLGTDDEFLKLARDAGCIEWHVGFDSVSQESLNSIGKKTNKIKSYKSSVKKIQDYGMTVIGEFVLGFDYDKKDIFQKTIDVIKDIRLNIPWLNILVPYPGTPLFSRLEKEGRILTKDWTKYTHLTRNVVFQPKHMSREELLNGTIDAYKELSSIFNILKRTFGSTNIDFTPFIHTFSKNINDAIIRYYRENLFL